MAYTQESRAAGSPNIPKQRPDAARDPEPTAWTGWVTFGGLVMVMVGFFGVIEGIAALFREQVFLVAKSGLLVSVNFTTWGWVHLVLGLLVASVGCGVLAGQTWARILGVGLVMVNAVVNLAFLAAFPAWSVIAISLDVLVIYALIAHGREVRS
jgi:hypothetical protein